MDKTQEDPIVEFVGEDPVLQYVSIGCIIPSIIATKCSADDKTVLLKIDHVQLAIDYSFLCRVGRVEVVTSCRV